MKRFRITENREVAAMFDTLEECVIWLRKQELTKDTILELGKHDQDKVDLHKYLKSLNIKIACVTNSIHETAELMLRQTGQLSYMDLLISNDFIKYPKPHGEGYIIAMVRLFSEPAETIIVEDSPVGIAAAKSTGANVMAVENSDDVIIKNLTKFMELI